MSYRSSDAYSRRPTDDDRRAPDIRDRRRDTFPRSGSDLHRDDRRRRSHDASPRDRRNPSESPRETPSSTYSTKLHVHVSSARSEHARAASTSRSPTDSPGLDKSTACEKLANLYRKYAEAVIDVARLRAERDPLEKALKQRQAEYEKSMAKHAELFPSVPELQNLHRVKYAERARFLDAQIQIAQHDVDSTAESIAEVYSNLSLAQNRDSEARTATPTVSLQQPEISKKHQAEISELKTKLRKIEAEHSQERTNLKAEFARRCAEMKEQMDEMKKDMMKEVKTMKRAKEAAAEEMRSQMEEMVKEMRRDLKEAEMIKSAKRDTTEEVKEELRVMRGELEKWQTEQECSQRNELRSRLSKQRQELTQAVEQQLLAHKNSSDFVSTTKVATLIQNESSALRSDVSDLLRRVDQLTGQLAQTTQDTVTLRGNLGTCARRVEEEARKLEEHEAKLSSLDTDALEGVAETISIDFPDLQRKVSGVQAKLDSVEQAIGTKQKTFFAQVETYVGAVGFRLGERMDEVENAVTKHTARINVLEAASTGESGPSIPEPSTAGSAEPESTNSDVIASIKSDFDSTKIAVNRLTQDYTGLSEKVTQVDKSVSTSSEDIKNQLMTVRHSLRILDSQFNNLSTKWLAELIIGHLEQVYPNAGQLAADIGALKTLVDGMGPRIDSLEGRVQDFKGGADGYHVPDSTKFHESPEVSRMQEHLFKDLNESSRPGMGHKRKRIDTSLNGAEHPITGGTEH